MNRFGKVWVRLPDHPRRGDLLEVRAMVVHPMESGFRLDNRGQPYPRHIVTAFRCRLDDEEVFRAHVHPAVARNPYLSFHLLARRDGELHFHWADDQGNEISHSVPLRLDGPGA